MRHYEARCNEGLEPRSPPPRNATSPRPAAPPLLPLPTPPTLYSRSVDSSFAEREKKKKTTKTQDTQCGRHRLQRWCEVVTPRPRGSSLVCIHPVRWPLLISSSQTCLHLFIYLLIYLSPSASSAHSTSEEAPLLWLLGSYTRPSFLPSWPSVHARRRGACKQLGVNRASRVESKRVDVTRVTRCGRGLLSLQALPQTSRSLMPRFKPSARNKYVHVGLFLLLIWRRAGRGRGGRIGWRRRLRRQQGVSGEPSRRCHCCFHAFHVRGVCLRVRL